MEHRNNGRTDDAWLFDDGDEMLTKSELLRIASEIISELPESQRRFFQDLYGSSRSQYKVAQVLYLEKMSTDYITLLLQQYQCFLC